MYLRQTRRTNKDGSATTAHLTLGFLLAALRA